MLNGGSEINQRVEELKTLLRDGHGLRAAAREMGLSESAVIGYTYRIKQKYGDKWYLYDEEWRPPSTQPTKTKVPNTSKKKSHLPKTQPINRVDRETDPKAQKALRKKVAQREASIALMASNPDSAFLEDINDPAFKRCRGGMVKEIIRGETKHRICGKPTNQDLDFAYCDHCLSFIMPSWPEAAERKRKQRRR